MMQLLGAYLICKNEEKSIYDTLLKNADFIRVFTVLDTGSTDATLREIERATADLRGRCEIHVFQEPFVNFAVSKNRARELHRGESLFELNLDCDEYIVGGPALLDFLVEQEKIKPPEFDIFHVTVNVDNIMQLPSPRLVRFDCAGTYIGVVHEVMYNTSRKAREPVVPGVQIFHTSRMDDPERKKRRWTQDAELLEQEKTKNPADQRTSFYLAQSYFTSGNYAASLREYKRRAVLGGFSEEVFESHLKIGVIHALENRKEKAIKAFNRAFCFSPDRAEPLVMAADVYSSMGNLPMCYLYALAAFVRGVPSRPVLFLNRGAYDFYPANFLANCGFAVGDIGNGKVGLLKAMQFQPDNEQLKTLAATYEKVEQAILSKPEMHHPYMPEAVNIKEHLPFINADDDKIKPSL